MNAPAPTRRQFLNTLSVASLAAFAPRMAMAQGPLTGEKWTLNLVGGAIGVNVGQREIIDLAKKFGFTSVEARPSELASMSEGELEEVLGSLKAAGLKWGTAGLPVDFRKDDARFEDDLKKLPSLAAVLKKAGVDRVNTWIMPTHKERTYLENFELHANRLRRVAQVLNDHGQRLGMEYVGTQTLMVRDKYPFLHTLAEAQELMARIGTGNVGVVLDSWHWWTAGDSIDAIKQLKNEDIILVDLNDAPKGVPKAAQLDGNRQLPASTGVIPIGDFLNGLRAVGYDGPIRAEPFNQTLNDLGNEAACQAAIDALRKAEKVSKPA